MGLKKRRSTNIKSWCGKNSAGFTLIELLIATLVLSMVIYLATLSYSLFLNTWERKKLSDVAAIQEYRSHLLLRNSIESIFGYYVLDRESERSNHRFPIFKGQKESLEFVTLSSVFHKGKPAVAQIKLEQSEVSNLKTLVYREASLEQTYIRYRDDPIEYKNRMPIYESLKSFRIRYFGLWGTEFDKVKQEFVPVYKWQETFEGKERSVVPDTIEMIVESEVGETKLVFPIMAHSLGRYYFFNREK